MTSIVWEVPGRPDLARVDMLLPPFLLRVNHFCRPVASLDFVTESFAALIVAHRCDVTVVSLVHFTLFGRSIHQLLRYDDTPLAYPALKGS